MPRPFKPPKYTRTWQAWNKVEEICADGEWHRWTDVVEEIMKAGGIQQKTAVRILGEAYRYGVLWKRGHVAGFGRGARVDTRFVKIPAPGEVGTGIDQVAATMKSPSRREDKTERTPPPASEEQTSRVEYEREKSTGKSRPRPVSSPSRNVNVHVEPEAVNPPGKVFTEAEARALLNRARRGKRRPIPGQPKYGR